MSACEFTVTLPGVPGSVPTVRAQVSNFLTGCPRLDDVLLVLSELASNAVRHSDSRLPGHYFQVSVLRADDAVRVEVHDDGSAQHEPAIQPQRDDTLGGRGLHITEELTRDWGTHTDGSGRVVWYVVAGHSAAAAA